MKLYRIETPGGPRWAKAESERLRVLEGNPFAGLAATEELLPLEGAKLLCPVSPSKIVAVGLNYRDHAAERNAPLPPEPRLFLKPPSAVIGPGQPIRVPTWAGRIDHEAELAIVIGRTAKNTETPEAASAAVLGAVCLNDVTARDLQDRDIQYTRAKGFDSFCPVGPCIALGLDWGRLQVQCRVNGQLRQNSNTSELIFDVPTLVCFVSRVMTLYPGDILSTGTPAGISPLRPGDSVEVEIEGVGVLANPVL